VVAVVAGSRPSVVQADETEDEEGTVDRTDRATTHRRGTWVRSGGVRHIAGPVAAHLAADNPFAVVATARWGRRSMGLSRSPYWPASHS
jgi:hypothetical protein